MIDQSWNELIEIVDRRIESRTTTRIDISNIEEIIAAVISRSGLPGKTAVAVETVDRETAVKETSPKAPKDVALQPKTKAAKKMKAAIEEAEPDEIAQIEEAGAVEEAQTLTLTGPVNSMYRSNSGELNTSTSDRPSMAR